MMQYFEWYLEDDATLWKKVTQKAKELSKTGFTALWLPPAYKGQAGLHDVGYGVYDLYDLGEFDQKGSIPTKYGTKNEYLKAIKALQKAGIAVYADMVFNHKMGADEKELVEVVENNRFNRTEITSAKEVIEAWTKFTFPARQHKYSSFIWDKSCFDGIDYDDRKKKTAIYQIAGKTWDQDVDDENGNYDYLMGADLDFSNPKVIKELYSFGHWYLDMCDVDGFRLDALKHIDSHFFAPWLKDMRSYSKKELFTVGEYWSSDLKELLDYLKDIEYSFSLFDVPLHMNFFKACNDAGHFDMGAILENTLMKCASQNAVTFVENHDTQNGQALQSFITDWFKPLAYALILLRNEGYPCVFYGDYYGTKYSPSFKGVIDLLLKLRQQQMKGTNHDYFDHFDIIGWTFEGESESEGLAIIMSDGPGGMKKMYVGKDKAQKIFVDVFGHVGDKVLIDENGEGLFKVDGGSLSVYVNQDGQDFKVS